jgi:hypothetical protein
MTPDTTTQDARQMVRDYKEIRRDYAFDPDIFNAEDERARRVKWIIDHRLSQVDKTIILLYADCASYRKLGERLRVSYVTAGREVLRIKRIILAEYAALTTEP